MQVRISGNHVRVSQAIEKSITKKLARLERHYHQITNAHVVLSNTKNGFRAECTVHASRTEIFADAYGTNLTHAIDVLVDKLDRQVVRRKEKLQDHRVSTNSP